MSKFCGCMDYEGYCCHVGCPYFLSHCPIPYNEYCPMGCNNPKIEEIPEEREEDEE